MKHDSWENEVLDEPDNDLVEIARRFMESGERVLYLDRHIFDLDPPQLEGVGVRIAACRAALKMLRRWSSARYAAQRSGALISKPFLVIDDAWLRQDDNPAPPHIYVCMAREAADLKPVRFEEVVRRGVTGDSELDELLTEGDLLGRVSWVGDDGPLGLWIVEQG